MDKLIKNRNRYHRPRFFAVNAPSRSSVRVRADDTTTTTTAPPGSQNSYVVLGVIVNDSGSDQDISVLTVDNTQAGRPYKIPSGHSTKVVRFDALNFIKVKSDIKCRAIITNFTDNPAYPKYFENKIFIPNKDRQIYIKYYQKGVGLVTYSAMNTYDIKVEVRNLSGTKEMVLVDDTMGFTCIGSVPEAKITENPQKNGSATSSVDDLTFDLRQTIGKIEIIDPNESVNYNVNIERGNEVKGRFPPIKIPYITVTNTTMNDMHAKLDIKGRGYNHKITTKKKEISINLQLGITKKATNIILNVLAEVVPTILTFGYTAYGGLATRAAFAIKAAKKAQQTAKTLKTINSVQSTGKKLTTLEKLNQIMDAGEDLRNFVGPTKDLQKYADKAKDLERLTGELDKANDISTKAQNAANTAKASVKESLEKAAKEADNNAQKALREAEKNAERAKEAMGKATKGTDEVKDAASKQEEALKALEEAKTKAAQTTENLNNVDTIAQSKIDELTNVTDDMVDQAKAAQKTADTKLALKMDELKDAEKALEKAKAGTDAEEIAKAKTALDTAKTQKEAAEKGLKEATDELDLKNAANAKNKSNAAADVTKTAQNHFDEVNNAAQKQIDDLVNESTAKIDLQTKIDEVAKDEEELAKLAENAGKDAADAIAKKSAELTKKISDNQKNILEAFAKIKEYKKLDIGPLDKMKNNWWEAMQYVKQAMNPFEWENMKKSTFGQKFAFVLCAAAAIAPLMANNMGDTAETEDTTEPEPPTPSGAVTTPVESPTATPTAEASTTVPPPPVIRA